MKMSLGSFDVKASTTASPATLLFRIEEARVWRRRRHFFTFTMTPHRIRWKGNKSIEGNCVWDNLEFIGAFEAGILIPHLYHVVIITSLRH